MIKVKDTKLTADIDTQPVYEYVTFWGKIKGQLEKQTDLYEWLQKLYNQINTLFKERLILSNRVDKVENILINEEERNIKDISLESDYLNYNLNKVEESSESSEEEQINNIKVPTFEYVNEGLNELYFTKQNNLTFKAGKGINVSVNESSESSEEYLYDEITIENTFDIENYYESSEIDALLDTKQDKLQFEAGKGISIDQSSDNTVTIASTIDIHESSEIDILLDNYYTKDEINLAVSNFYTKQESDNRFNRKINYLYLYLIPWNTQTQSIDTNDFDSYRVTDERYFTDNAVSKYHSYNDLIEIFNNYDVCLRNIVGDKIYKPLAVYDPDTFAEITPYRTIDDIFFSQSDFGGVSWLSLYSGKFITTGFSDHNSNELILIDKSIFTE